MAEYCKAKARKYKAGVPHREKRHTKASPHFYKMKHVVNGRNQGAVW